MGKQKYHKLALPKKLKVDDYELLKVIGVGSFGRVRLAREKRTKKILAIKVLKKSEIIRLKQVDHIISECCILGMIDHPFIVKLYGVMHDECYLSMVMDFVQGGELFTYLREVNIISINQAKFFAGHIVSIFEYLHSKNIIYRDLKPENLLIDNQGYLKLTDFGFAKVCEGRTYTLCGTPEYLAPEMILNKGHGKPVDWWTLGILLYEMLAGIDPFSDDDPNPMIVYQNILKGRIRFPKNFDKDAKSLVKHLLTLDVTKRYGNLKGGINDIKNHRFFHEFSFLNLLTRSLKADYIPHVKGASDTSRFSLYPDTDSKAIPVLPAEDPFKAWQIKATYFLAQ
eukprot:TRINITY_DN2218_c0_g1_i7.p1 TRINITY_DN2218_c0_g1~~TRINITY_DN2218_c0_g1_i7.p1  ORF type:complete len:340 (+),score=18.65 TRINITY_DN2218_c0_g1_i7:216-1235(+)